MSISSIVRGLLLLVAFLAAFHYFYLSKQQPPLATNIDIPESSAVQEHETLNHVACIMDGNRRWAKERGMKPWEGHKAGIDAVRTMVEFCIQKKIKYLSLYTFSSENFNRPVEEVSYLFDLMMKEAQKGVEEFKKNDIRLRFIGDRSLFPSQLLPLLDKFETETADCKTITVAFLFCYGARQEIVAAAKSLAHDVRIGKIKEEDINSELIRQHMWNKDMPDPDLIIRTGYVSRLSNFLLYEAAYSELYMMDCYWPDLTKDHLQKAYDAFMNTQRRFGT